MGKILITGPGRSGTTFLVQLLTRLGVDTGFEPGSETYVPEIRAGCEWQLHFDVNLETPGEIRRKVADSPRVLKSPEWGMALKWLLAHGAIELDHVFVPFRDLDVAARSRLDAGLDWMVDPTLEGEEREQDQAAILAMALGRTLEACLLWQVPCTVMRFPLFVQDVEYCYEKVSQGVDVDLVCFVRAWEGLARPEQIKWGAGYE